MVAPGQNWQGEGQVGLEDVLTVEALETLVKQPGVAERLTEFLPDELRSNVRLPSPVIVETRPAALFAQNSGYTIVAADALAECWPETALMV